MTLLDLHDTFLDYLLAENPSCGRGRCNFDTARGSLRRYIKGTDFGDPYVVKRYNYTDSSTSASRMKNTPVFMVRKGSWKLMILAAANSNALDMLYDLRDDPYETKNILGGKGGMSASDAVVGKAEHPRALLMENLSTDEIDASAMADFRRIRKWRSVDLWVGDISLQFRRPPPNGTRSEKLYIGCSVDDDEVIFLNVTIKGGVSGHYSLDWKGGVIPGNTHRALTFTFDKALTSDLSAVSARLMIWYETIDVEKMEKTIVFLGPVKEGAPLEASMIPSSDPTTSKPHGTQTSSKIPTSQLAKSTSYAPAVASSSTSHPTICSWLLMCLMSASTFLF